MIKIRMPIGPEELAIFPREVWEELDAAQDEYFTELEKEMLKHDIARGAVSPAKLAVKATRAPVSGGGKENQDEQDLPERDGYVSDYQGVLLEVLEVRRGLC